MILATNNKGKLMEIKKILKEYEIYSLKEKNIDIDVVEDENTFYGNALKKAKEIYEISGEPVIADDSGLCVDALDGRPGIYSARYAGENATDSDKNNKLLSELKDVPEKDRTAHFTCAICCILPNGEKIEVEGICEGSIAFEPHGNGGFGYDPIFKYGDKSYAELSSEEKDAISHRGKALRKLKAELEKYLDK